ncbi:MAG: DUF4388 domain-containing protein [Myxococcota bacterium]
MNPQGEDWTFSRVLTLMDEQDSTGILEIGVPSTGTTTHIHMRRGYVVDVEEVVGDHRWLLGDYLVLSGTTAHRKVVAAEKEAARKKTSVAEALVEANAVSADVLKRFVDLQTTELLFPLFEEEGLQIQFLEERPRTNPHATDLPVSYLLKEAERRHEHWPKLRNSVGRTSAVYDADKSVLAELLGYDEPAEDEDGEELAIPEVGMNTRIVFFLTNGAKTVEQVARASGLSLYDTYQAYDELLNFEVVDLITPHSKGEERSVGAQHLPRLVTVFMYGFIAVILGLGGQWFFTHAEAFTPSSTASTKAIVEAVQTATFEQIEGALQLYALRHGTFPGDLETLISESLMRPNTRDTMAMLSYQSDGAHYALAWSP